MNKFEPANLVQLPQNGAEVGNTASEVQVAIVKPGLPIVVEARGLTKTYAQFHALSQVNFQIEQGGIYGFIGPNGAGKTTMMRILATLLEPTSGEAYICGIPVSQKNNHWEIRRLLGYMPDVFGVYDRMRVWEYMDFYAAAYRVEASKRKALVKDLLDLVDLSTKINNYTDTLSLGMRQRLCLARCLIHDPKLLLLDEPASGLDPRARVELRELLKELSRMGKTVIISSHILTELSEMCTHIGIIERGQMLVSGKVNDILNQVQQHNRRLKAKFNAHPNHAGLIGLYLERAPHVTQVQYLGNASKDELEPKKLIFELGVSGDEKTQIELLRYIVGQNLPLYELKEEQDNLEDIFLRVTKGSVA